MTHNKLISSLLIAGALAASASTPALAGDRGHDGGAGVAIAAGILGAVVIGSLIANSQPTYAAPQPYYQPQPQPYYEPQPYPSYALPPQTYYSPQPVQQAYYVAPQPYYAPRPAIVINGRYHTRDGYYYSR